MATSAYAMAAGTSTRLDAGLIAAFRVGLALMWVQNVAWKPPPAFGEGDPPRLLYRWTLNAVEYEVFAPYAWIVENLVLPNFRFFGWVVLIVEASLGAFLLVGLLTRLWALVGVGQTVAIALSALNAPDEWHWAYLLMLLAHVAVFATAAGSQGSIDGGLRGRVTWDRAATVLGLASLASVVFVLPLGDFRFVQLDGPAVAVAVVLGLLAAAAGWLGRATLVVFAGAAFLAAAVLQVVLVTIDADWLGGNLSTSSLWLGLGAGLLTVGLTRRVAARAPA